MIHTRHGIETFLHCRRKYFYKELEGIGDDTRKGTALIFGSLFDLAQQEYAVSRYVDGASHDKALQVAVDSWDCETVAALPDKERNLLEPLFNLWANWWDINCPEVTAIQEQVTLTVPLPNGDTVQGTLDFLVETPAGWVLVENKTTGKLEHERLGLDFQLAFYAWLCYEARFDLSAIWWVAVKKGPLNGRDRRPKHATDLIEREIIHKSIAGTRRFGKMMLTVVDEIHRMADAGIDLALQTPNPLSYRDDTSCIRNCEFYGLCESEWNSGPAAEEWLRSEWHKSKELRRA